MAVGRGATDSLDVLRLFFLAKSLKSTFHSRNTTAIAIFISSVLLRQNELESGGKIRLTQSLVPVSFFCVLSGREYCFQVLLNLRLKMSPVCAETVVYYYCFFKKFVYVIRYKAQEKENINKNYFCCPNSLFRSMKYPCTSGLLSPSYRKIQNVWF